MRKKQLLEAVSKVTEYFQKNFVVNSKWNCFSKELPSSETFQKFEN